MERPIARWRAAPSGTSRSAASSRARRRSGRICCSPACVRVAFQARRASPLLWPECDSRIRVENRADLAQLLFRPRGGGLETKLRSGCVTASEGGIPSFATRSDPMAKQKSDSVYRIVDVVGVSEESWEDAGRNAVETEAGSLRDLRVAEVVKMDMRVENGKVTAFRTRVALSFKYEA